MKIIKNYEHKIASHCESGSVRNILKYSGLNLSESLIFGIGSGVAFAYMVNKKSIGGFPITAARLPMGAIVKNIQKDLGVNFFNKKFKSTDEAIIHANEMIDKDIPVAVCVDMFYMSYLPRFMQIHAPFHFVVLVGREGDNYFVSDPYNQQIGTVNIENLRSAWETHAMFAQDNLMVYVKDYPKEINWKPIIKKALLRSCDNLLIAPVVRDILKIFGYKGIELFAKDILKWTQKYKGLQLRECMLGTPTILEEQGTGGGAFRFLFSAFLTESSDKLNITELDSYAKEMNVIGEKWRDASRAMIKVAKEVPSNNNEYDSWFSKNEKEFLGKLSAVSSLYMDIAKDEFDFFTRLQKFSKNI